ncbi:hypothetical protein HID58_033386 [Brassica napus]|uniref:BnaA09g17200D protein n=3 Tax=Brassica TaxID=3705 RepID=A0A078FIV2_BRANA|nr:hypothetical protein HID58_033385 [Brassica napus]CAG7861818.1 unnamed protein product [Brassica rapa]KAH0910065.1 hypothetical protein HID58_033386 [Brassica napus]CAF2041481.1 unnamed protein product [Brassica napus]CAF2041482.1 unnamed protein product [Brassica napus]
METIICCGLRLKHRFQLRIFETILREFLKSFLLHIQLWLDVLDLQVGVDELEFLVILIHWFPFLLFREFVGFLLWVIIQAIKLAQLLLWHYISWQERHAEFEVVYIEAANAPTRTPPLPAHFLHFLPLSTMAESTDNDICTICQEPYRAGDAVRTLPCDHSFHSICVDQWLISDHGDCPLCKQAIVSE